MIFERLTATPAGIPRVNILGVGVHAVDMPQAVGIIEDLVMRGEKGYVCLSGVHGIMEAHRDSALLAIVNGATLVAPDGMPTVWLGRLQGLANMRRVFGPELMLNVCRRSVEMGFTHFLYGGNVNVAEELQANLERIFPGIRIVGTYTPPFRPLTGGEETALARRFAQLNPDITWVGLSTPKQDRFMARYLPLLDTRVMVGVGAAFDMHTGRIRDCPDWMKPAGLQWLHRLLQEPSRLWHRYLYYNPLFIYHTALQLAGLRKYELQTDAPAPRSVSFPIPPQAELESSNSADIDSRAS